MNRDELLDKLAMELDYWPEGPCYTPKGWVCELEDSEVVITNKDRTLHIRKDHWSDRRTELINCPPDSEAPSWAKWKAQDADGQWHWYESKPSASNSQFDILDEDQLGRASTGKIPAGHDWRTTLTEVNTMTTTAHEDQYAPEPTKREFNPSTSSLPNSEARELAIELKECSDGKPCGTPPRVGDDAYCAECPNASTPEEDAEWRLLDDRLKQDIPAKKPMSDEELERNIAMFQSAYKEATKDPLDTGAHYRHEYYARITNDDIARGYVAVKLDPYRICKIYNMDGGPREHATKKLLRGTSKGDTERQLIKQVRDALDRWEEMLDEDGAS